MTMELNREGIKAMVESMGVKSMVERAKEIGRILELPFPPDGRADLQFEWELIKSRAEEFDTKLNARDEGIKALASILENDDYWE